MKVVEFHHRSSSSRRKLRTAFPGSVRLEISLEGDTPEVCFEELFPTSPIPGPPSHIVGIPYLDRFCIHPPMLKSQPSSAWVRELT